MCSNRTRGLIFSSCRGDTFQSYRAPRFSYASFKYRSFKTSDHERQFHQSRKLLQYFISRLFGRSVDRSVGRSVGQSVDIHVDDSPGTSKELYF